MAQKGKVSKLHPKLRKKKVVPKPPWWQQPRWIGSIVGCIAVVALIVAGVVWGPALFSTGKETSQVISFTLASETVAEDECPVFNFEVANAKRITITQDDEIIMDIEITVPGTPAAYHQPWQGEVYALTETQPGVETHYCPGVYPVIYEGASSGRPSTIIHKEPEEGGEEGGSAVLEVISLNGQVVKAEVAYNIVQASERSSDQHAFITAPDCVEQDASSTAEPKINYFRFKNQTMELDEPEFEFSVEDAGMVKITEGKEVVFYIQATTLGAAGASRQPWQGQAYALTETQPGVETHYCQGIFPVGFKGASNGKPSKEIWKFGDTSGEEPSASIIVCLPSGDVLTEVLPFPFVVCPDGCDCLTREEGVQRGCYTGTAWIASSLCPGEACGVDEYGQEMHCCSNNCPEGCDCLTWKEAQQCGCGVYSGTAFVSTCVCTHKECGTDKDGPMFCCPKPPVVWCSLSSTNLPSGGGYVNVGWASENADEVTLSISSATPGQVSLTGNLGASVTKDTCFTFTAKNKCGMTSTAKCCVDVEQPPPPPPVPRPYPQPTPTPAPTPAPEPEPPCEEDEFDPTF
ncbi:MAG: hypothetical protein JXB43_06485 [Dehalococcoidia bacterium]|nr:hypothetical protein [Dehalococcoidia bacterium]